MAQVRPFKAVRPPSEKATQTSAVPYDVVNTAEARDLAAGNPLSFLHVSRPEIDLDDSVDPHADVVYERARQNYEWLTHECPLITESEPSLYVYRLTMGDHTQTGIAGCCSVDEYGSDIIRKHERTRKDKEDDRTRHILTLRAQTGPVFIVYRGQDEINEVVNGAMSEPPLYDFKAPDGVQHTVWKLSAQATRAVSSGFNSVPLLYIADGHHRAASASRSAAELRNKDATGPESEYEFFLCVLFPDDQAQILPYNRLVKDLNGLAEVEFLKSVSRQFDLVEGASPAPSRKGEISMYLGGRWYGLHIRTESIPAGDPISSLDVSILQDRVLDPLLGIKDVRTDKRIDFVGGIRGTSELEKAVDSGRAAVAFSMYPVTIDELIAIADAGSIMPPKSTWFEPKLRDGLLIHAI